MERGCGLPTESSCLSKPWALWAVAALNAAWAIYLNASGAFSDFRVSPVMFSVLAFLVLLSHSKVWWTFAVMGNLAALIILAHQKFSIQEATVIAPDLAVYIALNLGSFILVLCHFKYPYVSGRGSFLGGENRIEVRQPASLSVKGVPIAVTIVNAAERGVALEVPGDVRAEAGESVELSVPEIDGFRTKAIVVRSSEGQMALQFVGWSPASLRKHLQFIVWLRKKKAEAATSILSNSKGYTLIEVVIVASLGALVLFGTLQITMQLERANQQSMFLYSVESLKSEIGWTIRDPQAWQHTIADVANQSLRCVREHSSCLEAQSRGPVRMRDSENRIFIDSHSPTAGIDRGGRPCNEFDPVQGNDACPLRFVVSWEPVCEGLCVNPAIRLDVAVQFRPRTGRLQLDAAKHAFQVFRDPLIDSLRDNCQSLNGVFNETTGSCEWTRLASHCKAGGQFPVGFDELGQAICAPIVAQSCPAGSWMVGFNQDGTIACEAN